MDPFNYAEEFKPKLFDELQRVAGGRPAEQEPWEEVAEDSETLDVKAPQQEPDP